MIGPDDFDDDANRPGLWTEAQALASGSGSNAVSAPAAAGGDAVGKGLLWLIAVVLIAVALWWAGAAQQQRHQREMVEQQRVEQQQRETAAAAERDRLAEAARRRDEERRLAEERQRKAAEQQEQAEIAQAERQARAFTVTERSRSIGVERIRFSLVNRCQAGDIRIALLYRSVSGEWVTRGWWLAKPDDQFTPDIWPVRNNNIYFFAEGSGFIWKGEDNAPRRSVVDNEFAFGDNDPPLGHNQRSVAFRLASMDSFGPFELNCKVQR